MFTSIRLQHPAAIFVIHLNPDYGKLLMRSRRLLFLCFLLPATFFSACKSAEEQRPATVDRTKPDGLSRGKDAVSENRSKIVATVLSVVRPGGSRFYLRLRVELVEGIANNEPAVKIGQIIEAYPNFKREEGKELDYTTEENKHMVKAGDLEEGNRIMAVVYYRGNSVLLMDWQRE